ncbi:hypothetical protein BRC75_06590 [Halobacteriales archaeon QH_7_69_31]|nr:MAG: hypothetical protein BRC75_06590 [Halobacteriales archaeon QH_7_69_31]
MTQGSEQGTLEAFDGGGGAPDRPAAEAAAVTSPDAAAADVVDRLERRFPEVDDHVECSVTQVDYTIEGDGDDERPVLHVHGRTADREPVHARVHDFRPYFYTPVADLEVAVDADAPLSSVDVVDSRLDHDRLTGVETYADRPGGVPDDRTPGEVVVYESIRGEELVKLFGQTPRDVGELRDRFEHYEADILFPNRLLIDKDIQSGVRVPAREAADGSLEVHHTEVEAVDCAVEPRVHTLDIEVDDRNGFPEDGEETIICLTSHDSYRDEYVVWLYESPEGVPGPDAIDDYEPIGDGPLDVDVRGFADEAEMLVDYIQYLDATDPDVLTGWNFDDFDAPYLIDRIERLERRADGLDADRLSRVGEVWHSGWGGPDVKGRVVFDLLYAYQRTQFSELDSYRLDAVGEEELGVGKERYPGDIGDLWEDDPEQLLEYNLRDVELCVELDRKQDIVPFWREVAAFVGCKLEDATTPGDAVDMYVLHETHGEFALPSKGQQEGEEYEGGAVFDPISGVREMVSVLDLASLYPMCMVTINASPETKVDPSTYDGETYVAPNGTRFRKDPDGVIRAMVDELLEEREQKKALRDDHDPDAPAYDTYDRQQAAVKVIMNCFTPDTDVLTPDGVRNIRDLDVDDEVYSLDPETMEMEVKPVVETHAYPDYGGELVDIETSKIDFSVTPNHRMIVRKNDKNGITEKGWSFVEAGELYDYCHYELPHGWEFDHQDELPDRIDLTDLIREYTSVQLKFAVGGTKLAASGGEPNVSRQVPVDDFLELLAWYITEGDVYEAKTGNYRVKIAQEDDEALDRIAGLPESSVEYYYTTDRKVSFSSRPVAELFQELCGAGSENKRIPDLVFEGSKEQKEKFLDTLIAGDGDRQPNSWRYSTKSKELRDDVLKLCTHLGITVTYSSDSGVWRLYCAEEGKNSFRMHRDGGRSTAENGVYCVTVEGNNTLIAGRNGKLHNVSNSLYGVLGWDRFRLYDKEMGAAVTATGRDVIEFTEEAANNVGYEVAYGDTDSVMLELGQDVPKQTAIEQSYAIQDHINDAYDEFAKRLNADEHRFEIEFEKLYRRFFQAGKKKRYAGHKVWAEGKDVDDLDITGFEYKRSDIAPITKEVQKEVLEMIVTGADREEITDYVHDVIQRVRAGDVSLEEIGIPGGIGKQLDNYETDTAQVRGAKYANLLFGTNFASGSKPKRLYLEKVHPEFFRRIEAERGLDPAENALYGEFKRDPDVICFEFDDQVPEAFEVDYDKMLDKTLKGPIARVLSALDISWEEVKSGQEQTGLGSFV